MDAARAFALRAVPAVAVPLIVLVAAGHLPRRPNGPGAKRAYETAGGEPGLTDAVTG